MKRVKGTIATALAVVMLGGATEANAGHLVAYRYVTGAPDPVAAATVGWATRVELTVSCAPDAATPSLGGVCFDVAEARAVEIEVIDQSGRHVSGTVWFESSAGRRVGRATAFCERVAVEVPPGATRGVVALDSTVVRCGLDGGGPATAGTVAIARSS